MASPFLEIPASEWVAANSHAFAIHDRYPVSEGHTLVVPRRLIATYFEATPDEKASIWALVEEVKVLLDRERHPDGYNVGFNVGAAAGQTVNHLHVHVIPRYAGDTDDPRGGVRHAVPGRGHYTRERATALSIGGQLDPFGKHIWPLLTAATDVAIVSAFVTETGLYLLEPRVFAALRAGARIRLVTGDYLGFTQATALRQLLGWSAVAAEAAHEAFMSTPGFQVRVVETAQPDGSERAFHPKSWRFEGPGFGVAFVGSSNLSRSALETGTEWNLRVERAIDPPGYGAVKDAFETLWGSALPLTSEWISLYEERAKLTAPPLDEAPQPEPLPPPPDPHEFQEAALAALANARSEGRRRALVVLATGLGKTWLAAFDIRNVAMATGRWPRVLFLAHREELLTQAARTMRQVRLAAGAPAEVGWCAGDTMQLDAPVVVGSVQKLARPENLDLLARQPFDYVVVDEVHHADAPTYRRILDRLDPPFMLGLTATPDRADEGDILGLFDDFVAYRADLGAGIERQRLVPFDYHGVRDDIDYEHIPWRNRRFDPAALAAAVQTERRMDRLWRAWQEHPGSRTLVFCCSIDHARFASDWLRQRGIRAEAVYAAPGSADRADCLERLAAGEIDAICVVDLFNEGVDVPSVDRVVMLRPTESPVIFLQQLGRGLRISPGKASLVVIDFVGNHRIFLERIRRLLSLVARPTSLREFLDVLDPGFTPELPPGCSIDLELEAKDLLRALLPRGAQEVEGVYRELVAARGDRPAAGELFRMGYRPESLRTTHGSWFDFVNGEGHLDLQEQAVLREAGDWLRELETSPMTKSFKMVVLEVLTEAEALGTGMPIDELARRSHALLSRSPELMRDLEGVSELDDPRAPSPEQWLSYWRKNPIAAWTRDSRWFQLDGDRLVPRFNVGNDLQEPLAAMTRELVDYRLARYRARTAPGATATAFVCAVTWNQRDPILKLPSPRQVPDRPQGEIDVHLPDGAAWSFRFAKEFCNVARPVATQNNRLPDLMRRWFGPAAGHPGTAFQVRFSRSPDGWWIEPVGKVLALPTRGRIVAFPSLRAAAGVAAGVRPDEPEAAEVTLPIENPGEDLFAVRAAGDSMNGGRDPIRDGDWLVMRWARGAGLGAVAGRVALVKSPDANESFAYQVKRVVQENGRWWLRSDNPEQIPIEATADSTPIALLVSHFRPEDLGPPVGSMVATQEIGGAFGLSAQSPEATGRYDGHLFLLVAERGKFERPDRLERVVADRRPGETAFVLAKVADDKPWRFCGVGRWLTSEEQWAVPPLDFETWRALGEGRESSRRLPPGALERATDLLDILPVGPTAWVEYAGRRCRVIERTKGGVRIEGGEGGMGPRVVSATDIAWVMVAMDDVKEQGGVLDETRVNRLRYLDGTPKESTRWIDSGWALVLVQAARS